MELLFSAMNNQTNDSFPHYNVVTDNKMLCSDHNENESGLMKLYYD